MREQVLYEHFYELLSSSLFPRCCWLCCRSYAAVPFVWVSPLPPKLCICVCPVITFSLVCAFWLPFPFTSFAVNPCTHRAPYHAAVACKHTMYICLENVIFRPGDVLTTCFRAQEQHVEDILQGIFFFFFSELFVCVTIKLSLWKWVPRNWYHDDIAACKIAFQLKKKKQSH